MSATTGHWAGRPHRGGILLLIAAATTPHAGLMRADAYAGFNKLYNPSRHPAPIIEAACWAHARRKFFDLARPKKAPIAIEAVERIDALFAIEREINGMAPQQRLALRQERSRPSSSSSRLGWANSVESSRRART
jgi:hypothetical protein